MNPVIAIAICAYLLLASVKSQNEFARIGNRRPDARHLLLEDKLQTFNKELIRIEGFDFLQRREAREKRGIANIDRDDALSADLTEGSGSPTESDSFKQPFGKILRLKTGSDYQPMTTKHRPAVTTKPSLQPKLPSSRMAADSNHELLIQNIFQKVAKQNQAGDPPRTTTSLMTSSESFKDGGVLDIASRLDEKQPVLIDEELELQEEDDNPQADVEEADGELFSKKPAESSGDWSFHSDEDLGTENSNTDELFFGTVIPNVMTAAPPEDVYRRRETSPKFSKDHLSSIPHGVAIQFLQTYCAAIVSAILAVTTIIVLCYIFYVYRQRTRSLKSVQQAEKAVVVRRTCSKMDDSPSVLNVTSDAELLGLHDTSVFDSPGYVYQQQSKREATRSQPPPPPPLP